MIKVKHPDPPRNRVQEELLQRLPAHQQRAHALLFSYGNAVYLYHMSVAEHQPTLQGYEDVNEKNDIGLRSMCVS